MQTVSQDHKAFGAKPHAAGLEAMQGGMTDPVLQSQAVFRAIMDAMARPGKVIDLAPCTTPPGPLSGLVGSILATLADSDTPLWLDPPLAQSKAVMDWLTFHVGAPFAVEPSQAAFAAVSDPSTMPALEVFALGDQDYPDRSTTMIIEVETLSNAPVWHLTGPGIKDVTPFRVETLPPLFVAQWADNNRLFPRGVDIILVSQTAIACLARTTKITLCDPNQPENGAR